MMYSSLTTSYKAGHLLMALTLSLELLAYKMVLVQRIFEEEPRQH